MRVVQDLIEQGLRHHRAGQLNEAKVLYEQALELQPRHPDALHLAGVIALQAGGAERAVKLIQQAIEVQPRNPAFHGNLAQAFLALQRVAEAQVAFRRAAALDPREPQFAIGAANCLALQGHVVQAERELRAVARRHPAYALAWFNLGNVLREQRRLQEAADMYQRVIRLDPALADAHNHLGCVLQEADHFEGAERAFRQYISLRPDSAAGYFNLASLLVDHGRAADAAGVCRQGIERFAGSASPPELQWMLGTALYYQGRFVEALIVYRAAVAREPENTRALTGYGVALLQTGNEQEGLRWLLRALDLEPDSPEFRHAIASVYLSLGDLQSGWREYRWRPARRGFLENFPHIGLASEMPDRLAEKNILLLSEQGLGDELFFLRFAAALKSRGAEITYRANAKIASLLERVPALDQVITDEVALPVADLTVLIGDLPRLLGRLESSPLSHHGPPNALSAREPEPGNVAGLDALRRLPRVFYPELPPPLALTPLPERIQELRRRLSELGPPPYRGLTWRAGTAPEQQRGSVWLLHKEIPLEQLGAAVRGVTGTLLALQRNPRPGEIESLSARAAMPVHDLSALNEDLEAMLALLALIDDYIGVSNTNMHLRAGAGRTAQVLVPRPAEWRSMISGAESPWFPGFRIYRQGMDGDWGETLATLARDLRDS